MKIKNLNVTKTGLIILTSATIVICSSCSIEKPQDFTQVMEDYNIISINQLDSIPEHCYKVLVSDPVYDDGPFHLDDHWDSVDSIDNVSAIAREYDADYTVLKLEYDNNKYVIHKKVVEDIGDRPEGYDYVFADDYLVEDDSSYEDVYLIDGKVLKRE